MPELRPVVRAEDFYQPPPRLPADAWVLVPPAERVVRWYEEVQQRRITVGTASLLGQHIYARINRGRWVGDCTCMSAQVVTPSDQRMWCVECGAGWWTVVFPDDVAAAEQEMALLPVIERDWWNPEDPSRPAPPPEPIEQPDPETPEV